MASKHMPGARTGVTDPTTVSSLLIISAEKDHLPLLRVLHGLRDPADTLANKIRGISPDFYCVGVQADPDNPVNVVIDEDRAAFFSSTTVGTGGTLRMQFGDIVMGVPAYGAELSSEGLLFNNDSDPQNPVIEFGRYGVKLWNGLALDVFIQPLRAPNPGAANGTLEDVTAKFNALLASLSLGGDHHALFAEVA